MIFRCLSGADDNTDRIMGAIHEQDSPLRNSEVRRRRTAWPSGTYLRERSHPSPLFGAECIPVKLQGLHPVFYDQTRRTVW